MAASAAYWIASSADDLVVTPSGLVGSIGVFAVHEDLSKALDMAGLKVTLLSGGKYKTEGNPYEPLSGGARQDMHSMFVQAVARGRNVSSSDVRRKFGEGRIVLAAGAARVGMADRVTTLDQTQTREMAEGWEVPKKEGEGGIKSLRIATLATAATLISTPPRNRISAI